MKHLGRLLEDDTISLDPASVHTFPEPRSKEEVFSFLGLAGWCREYVPNFSQDAFPLSEMLRKYARPHFDSLSSAQQKAFNDIKALITSAPSLRLPDLSRPFQLEVDASKYGFGCVLFQDVNGKLIPCGY